MSGRIAREEWIEQAKELAAGKPPRAKIDKEAKAEKAKTAKTARKSKE
jgi:large subunit ribosomal protein L21